MVSAIVFAQVWGVVQLIVLTTLARTVRVRTVFAAMAVGFYLIGPITAFIQLSWIHLAAPLFGMSADRLAAIASYSVDPFIEETAKLLPLALLMLIPAIRRQWSLTDCVLVAAATGSGFGLTEHLFRYAAYPQTAAGVAGGWVIPFGQYMLFVPGFIHTLTSWITNGAYFSTNPIDINWHLAWSAIGGLAVGLFLRRRDKKARLSALGLFVFIGLNHAAGNALHVSNTWLGFLAAPLYAFSYGLGTLVVAVVAFAWWLDQPSQRAGMTLGPLLAAEQTASSPRVGTLNAALRRFPWSLPWVYGFDRERRAFHAAHATAVEGREAMLTALVAKRDALEQKLKETGRPALMPAWLTMDSLKREVRAALRRPPVILWLVLITPSVLFLIVGGFPQTAWLQRFLTAPVIWPVVMLITVVGQVRVALRVFNGMKRLPSTARLPIGDDAAVLSLQLACGIGSVVLGAFTLERVLSGIGAREHVLSGAHASDAAKSATPGSTAATAGSTNAATGPSSGGSPGSGSSSGSSPSSGGGEGKSGNRSGGPPPAPNPNPLPPPAAPPDGDAPAPPAPHRPTESITNDRPPPAPNPNPLPPPPPPPIGEISAPPPAEYLDNAPPTPSVPVNDLPDAPQQPSVPVNDLPDAPQQPSVPVNDLPDAPQQPSVPVNDLPDAPTPTRNPAPPAPQPLTPQQLADQAAQNQTQAAQDAADAHQDARNADDADESAGIKSRTADPSSDPSVAAAQARAKAAADAAAAASDKAAQGEDPLDPIKNQEAANDAKQAARDAAQDAQDAEDKFQEQQQAAADAAKAAAKQAEDAAAAADAKAAAAKDAASTAQSNADAAAAKAATDAARAADPAQAAANDAKGAAAAAQARADAAFYQPDNQSYHDANAAAAAAQAKAEAAQRAADAAHRTATSTTDPHKKP